jgi:hypothetical protein
MKSKLNRAHDDAGSFLRNEPNFSLSQLRAVMPTASASWEARSAILDSAELAGLAEVVARIIQVKRLHEAIPTRPRRRDPLLHGMPRSGGVERPAIRRLTPSCLGSESGLISSAWFSSAGSIGWRPRQARLDQSFVSWVAKSHGRLSRPH